MERPVGALMLLRSPKKIVSPGSSNMVSPALNNRIDPVGVTIMPPCSAVMEVVLDVEFVDPESILFKSDEGSTPVSPKSPEPVYPESVTRLSGIPSEFESVTSPKKIVSPGASDMVSPVLKNRIDPVGVTIMPPCSAVIEIALDVEFVEPESILFKINEGSTPVSPNSPEPVYPESVTGMMVKVCVEELLKY